MLKIGITGDRFIQWGGGLDFLRTIVSSLQATSVPLEFHFLLPGTGAFAGLQRFDRQLRSLAKTMLGFKSAKSYAPSHADLQRSIVNFDAPIQVHEIDVGMRALAHQARYLSLDVLLPSFIPLPFGRELPWIGYLYDFQHRNLPQFFTERERDQRDYAFQSMLMQARGVIVNAQAVAADINRFYPDSKASVFALPFSTAPSQEWFTLSDVPIRKQYRISCSYFIICNQFWQHKDHITAFEAFAEFVKCSSGSGIDLVCTGATSDYRSIDYFNSLIEIIRKRGLQERIHILGLIPKSEQIALLRGAIALIQPTLNEGGPGGGAVYDAVAVGVPAIVSDIPVNLEIVGEKFVSFFKARDPVSLANAMRVCVDTVPLIKPTATMLIEQGRERRLNCGNTLLTAIDYVRR